MALRKRINYRWRLFLPIVGMMWLLMIVLVIYHYKSAANYREANLRAQLSLVNNRIIAAYEDNVDMNPFIDFIERYFEDTLLDDVMVRVYNNATGDTIRTIGPSPRELDLVRVSETPEKLEPIDIPQRLISDKLFYVSTRKSNDGHITVLTALPFSGTLAESLRKEPSFWIVIILIALVFTLIAYLSTQLLSRSVRLLKNFADNIENNDVGMQNVPEFPHDELGDISRRIIQLYRDKDDANRRSEREHAVALHAIEERSRIKRQLTDNLNHELKTPIGVIRGYLDTIISSPDMDQATKDRFISRAHDNVERLCAMLDDVSTITRLEEASQNITMADVDFHELVYKLAQDFEVSNILKGMKFEFDIPLNCHVTGNATLLSAMINNLAKNAVIHSHGTTMGIKLIIESKRFYTFAFYDDGQGVESEHLPRLFERFYRVDSGRSRKVGGTGLGLPIVKNTVEAHGGTISIHNRAVGGLEFVFTLPKADE